MKIRVGNGKNPPYWGDELSIKIVTIKEENFLHAVVKSLDLPINVNNKVSINVTPIMEAYENAFEIDLSNYAISNYVYIKK